MKSLITLLGLALLITGCADPSSRKAPNGFEMKIIRQGSGEFGLPGQYVSMNMLYKDSKDSVWFDTRKLERPGVIQVPDTSYMKSEKGMESVFRAMKKGDSVSFTVSMKSLFEETWKSPPPPGVSLEGSMTFFIGVQDILDERGMNELRARIQAQQIEKAKQEKTKQLGIDTVAIDAYLASHQINALKTNEGVRYVMTRIGKGPSPVLSNTIKVNYKGSFLADGTVFDQSGSAPLELMLGNFITGWHGVLMKMQKGGKATLYIPSGLAYGASGSPPLIPPNANLVFEVELLDFK